MVRRWMLMGCLLGLAVTARAEDWFPLTAGMLWRYVSVDGGATQTRYVSGTLTIFDRATVEIETYRGEGPAAEHFRRYWSRDEEGNLLLHATWSDGGTGTVYDPPLVAMPATPVPGEQWTSTVHVYDGWPPQHDTCRDTLTFTCRVGEPDTITVPAGTFVAYPVVRSVTARQADTTAGRPAARSPVSIRTIGVAWYAAGVGLVKDGEFELADPPAGERSLGWGELKRRYR